MIHSLRARYVFPVSSEPIADGMIAIQGERIVAVGKDLSADTVEDLGNVAILPGLVNAHTHLEFSNLEKPLGAPGIGFADWVRLIRRESAEDRIQTVKKGFDECLRCGVTTIGEIAQPDLPMPVMENPSADCTAFVELIAPTKDRVDAALAQARNAVECEQHAKEISAGWRIGLSPHAPFTIRWDLLEKIVELSVYRQIPLAMHLAESRDEMQLLHDGDGPLKQLLNDLGIDDLSAIGSGIRPLDYLQLLAVADRVLIIHGNYLTRDEIGLLADMSETMPVVYCPRTHEYFRNDRYPLEHMLKAGVTVCLGTDSRATSPDLDLLAEIRHVSRHYPAIPPRIVLKLGTINGAKALGRDQEIGSLQPGKYANLAIVPLSDDDTDDPYKLLLASDISAKATWYHGVEIMKDEG